MAYKKLKLWFYKELAQSLANKIEAVCPEFKSKSFVSELDKNLDKLELKDRIELMADKLAQSLSGDYKQDVIHLLKILGSENEEEEGMFINFYWVMPIAKYVWSQSFCTLHEGH